MRIAAVPVNLNQAELTRECVLSLSRGTLSPTWIIVIDNGSQSDPSALLQATQPQNIVVRHARNLGFAPPANAGIERALALGADAVLLINNDAVVGATCLAVLASTLEEDG